MFGYINFLMSVKFQEPVGGKVIYRKESHYSKKFSERELEKFIEGLGADLDEICEGLVSREEVSVFDYIINFRRSLARDNSRLYPLDGGLGLSVDGMREFLVRDFQKRYRRGFEQILESQKDKSEPLDINISLIGYRDTITR